MYVVFVTVPSRTHARTHTLREVTGAHCACRYDKPVCVVCVSVCVLLFICVSVCVCVYVCGCVRARACNQNHNKHETNTKSESKARVYLLTRTVWTDLTATVGSLPQHGHTPLTHRPALAHPEMTVTVDWADNTL